MKESVVICDEYFLIGQMEKEEEIFVKNLPFVLKLF